MENTQSRVINVSETILFTLRETVLYFDKGGYMMSSPWVRRNKKEQFKKYMVDSDGFFPTGIIHRVKFFLESRKIDVEIFDNRVVPKIGNYKYNMRCSEPTAYNDQTDCTLALLKAKQGIAQVPTGVGKTRIIKDNIQQTGVRSLVITPSTVLKEQMADYLESCFGSENVGIYDKRLDSKPITIINYHSFGSTDNREWMDYHLVEFDEFHHCLDPNIKIECKGYAQKIEDIYNSFYSKNKKRNKYIKSWNGKEIEYKKIINAFRYKSPDKMLRIKIKDEDGKIKELLVTSKHKIFKDGKKVFSKDLKTGDKLYLSYTTQKEARRRRSKNPEYRKHLSERASKNNKNRSLKSRESQSIKMKKNIKDGIISAYGRGKYGNGRELTPTQKELKELFPFLEVEYQINLKSSKKPGWYKVDLALIDKKIAIEVDGSSHKGREDSDNKKELRLGKLGWKVFRIPENYSKEQLFQLKRLIQKVSTSMI